jgi:hypothetical protein
MLAFFPRIPYNRSERKVAGTGAARPEIGTGRFFLIFL